MSSVDLPSIQTNFAPYLPSSSPSSTSLSNTSNKSSSFSTSSPSHHHPQRMPLTPSSAASSPMNFQTRSFSLTSRFSSSSLHSQYSACSTNSGRSPSSSPGPATPCDVLSRSPSFSNQDIRGPAPQKTSASSSSMLNLHHGVHGLGIDHYHRHAQDKQNSNLILSPFSPQEQHRDRYSHQLPPLHQHGPASPAHHHSQQQQPYQQFNSQQRHHPYHSQQPQQQQQQYQQPAHYPHQGHQQQQQSHHVDSIPHPVTTSATARPRQYSGQQQQVSSPSSAYPPQSPLHSRDHVEHPSQREFHDHHSRSVTASSSKGTMAFGPSSASTTPSGMIMMNNNHVGDYFSRPSTPPSSASHFSPYSSFSASLSSSASYSHHLPTPSTPVTTPVVKEEIQCPSRPINTPASISTPTFPPPQTPSSFSSILTTPLTPTLPHLQISTTPRPIASAGQSSCSSFSNGPLLKSEEFSPKMRHLLHHRRSVSMSSDEHENGQEYSRESSPGSYPSSSHPQSRTHSHTSAHNHQLHHHPFGAPHFGNGHHPFGHHGLPRPPFIKHEPYIKHEMLMSPSSPSCSPTSPSSPHSGHHHHHNNNNNASQLLLCPVCSRAFKPSKNQNCNLRRHLKNVHNMSPTMHPRKCKWDSLPDGRVKDDKDRKERTRKSKRLWARKFRQRRKVEEAAVVLSMLSQAL